MRRRFIIIECSGPLSVYYIILIYYTLNNGTKESGSIVYVLK